MLFFKLFLRYLISKSGEQLNCSILPAEKQTDKSITHNISLGGKMKNLRVLMVAFLVLGLTGVMMAHGLAGAVGVPVDEEIGGTIPFNAQWTFTATDQTAKLADADETVYDDNLIEILDIQVCTNLDANDTLSVAAKISAWTLPGTFPSNGNKNTVDGTSDFKILANHFKAETPGLTHTEPFDEYSLLTSTDQEIIHSIPAAGNAGVEDEIFDIDCQVELNWLTDAPGAYSITMTLTLSQNPE